MSDAPAFVHRLMLNVAENMPCPPSMFGEHHGPGMLWNAASSIASVSHLLFLVDKWPFFRFPNASQLRDDAVQICHVYLQSTQPVEFLRPPVDLILPRPTGPRNLLCSSAVLLY